MKLCFKQTGITFGDASQDRCVPPEPQGVNHECSHLIGSNESVWDVCCLFVVLFFSCNFELCSSEFEPFRKVIYLISNVQEIHVRPTVLGIQI